MPPAVFPRPVRRRGPLSPFRPGALLAVLLLLAVAGSALLAPRPVVAAERLPDPDDRSLSGHARVEALMERVRREQKKLQTLQAAFVQRQESAMLLEPEVSTGTFSYAAPESVRWEYDKPNPISVVIDGEEMTTWYRDLERAERLKVGRYSNQVLKYLGASGSFDTLLEYFQVKVRFPEEDQPAEPYRVELTPRYERIARRLSSMTIWVDRDRFLPVRLRYESPDGDVTEYEFRDLQINASVPKDRFHLDLPAGVEVREIDLGRS